MLELSSNVNECKPLVRGAELLCDDHAERGRTVQVDPIKPTLNPPRTKRLKVKHDKLLSICFNFALKINLRRYNGVDAVFLCYAMDKDRNMAGLNPKP